MLEQSTALNSHLKGRRNFNLEEYFITTGFYDLLPLAVEMAGSLGYDTNEIIEAICKVHDKFSQFPPTKNRTAWFRKVFEEKLREAKGDILTFRAASKYFAK